MEKSRLSISKLLLDTENFRLGPLENQRDVIINMIEDQKWKLVNLLVDIAENGLSPLENIAVVPNSLNDGTYNVVEGNRRVLALKILADPDILDGTLLHDQKEKIIEELAKITMVPIDEIECVSFDTQEDAAQWMQLKHTGENEGRGTVPWSATAKTRMAKKYGEKGRNSSAIEIIDFMSLIGKDIPKNYPITNLTRLLGTPEIRKKLGIVDIFPITVNCPYKFFVNTMSMIIDDMGEQRAVSRIYYKNNRLDYINQLNLSIYEEVQPWIVKDFNIVEPGTDTVNTLPAPQENNQGMQPRDNATSNISETSVAAPNDHSSATVPSSRQIRSIPLSQNRSKLIPSSCSMRIPHPRLNKIYKELKELNLNDFPNAAAVLFRVFLELSLDEYLVNKSIETDTNIIDNLKLKNKVAKVKEYMLNNSIMTANELHPVDTMISDPSSYLSIKSLNSYIHNSDAIPINRQSLNNIWDRMQLFIEKLWI